MPRLTRKLPLYRLHKASGQTIATLNGKDVYFGIYGSPQSEANHKQVLGRVAGGPQTATTTGRD